MIIAFKESIRVVETEYDYSVINVADSQQYNKLLQLASIVCGQKENAEDFTIGDFKNIFTSHWIPDPQDIAIFLALAKKSMLKNKSPLIVSLGAGTCVAEALLAKCGATVYAVEPNTKFIEKIAATYKMTKIACGYRGKIADAGELVVVQAHAQNALENLQQAGLPLESLPEEIIREREQIWSDYVRFIDDYSRLKVCYGQGIPQEDADLYENLLYAYFELQNRYRDYVHNLVTVNDVLKSPVDMLFSSYMPLNMDYSEFFYRLRPRAILQIAEASGATGFNNQFFYENEYLKKNIVSGFSFFLPKLKFLKLAMQDNSIVLFPSYHPHSDLYKHFYDDESLQGHCVSGGSVVLFCETVRDLNI